MKWQVLYLPSQKRAGFGSHSKVNAQTHGQRFGIVVDHNSGSDGDRIVGIEESCEGNDTLIDSISKVDPVKGGPQFYAGRCPKTHSGCDTESSFLDGGAAPIKFSEDVSGQIRPDSINIDGIREGLAKPEPYGKPGSIECESVIVIVVFPETFDTKKSGAYHIRKNRHAGQVGFLCIPVNINETPLGFDVVVAKRTRCFFVGLKKRITSYRNAQCGLSWLGGNTR